MNDEYISIKEFAEKLNCSQQNIYQKIKRGTLNQFTKSLNGKKYIHINALRLFENSEIKQDFKQNSTFIKQIKQELENSLIEVEKERTRNKELSEQLELLKVEKESLKQQNYELNQKVLDFAERFATIAEQSQKLHLLSEAPKKNIFMRLFGKK
jgi:predicted DNA-binding protein YlxM (UPF0122 family)